MTGSIKERVYELLNNPAWYNYGPCCSCPNFNGGYHECTPDEDRALCKKWRLIKKICKSVDKLEVLLWI